MKRISWRLSLAGWLLLIILLVGCGGSGDSIELESTVDSSVIETAVAQTVEAAEALELIVQQTVEAELAKQGAGQSPQQSPVPETATPEEEVELPTATSEPSPTATTEPEQEPAETVLEEAVSNMTLIAKEITTQHSPRPEPFVPPESLDDLPPISDDSWQDMQPGETTAFKTFDGVRIEEAGEAILDLGEQMRLVLRRDTVAQNVPTNLAEDKIQAEFGEDTPLLQQVALAMHLLRGGFQGEKSIESGPIALTTPNAVVVVSGTEFFLTYDPDSGTTTVGNFGGTMEVGDVNLKAEDPLPDRQLMTIAPVRKRKFWPIHDHMTPDEFARLTDMQGSPAAAADMISGVYLTSELATGLPLRTGPGSSFAYLGDMDLGDYARVIGGGSGWWQIECPPNVSGHDVDCWVAGGEGFTNVYNDDIAPVPRVTAAATKAPTGTATATPTLEPGITVTLPLETPEVGEPEGPAPTPTATATSTATLEPPTPTPEPPYP